MHQIERGLGLELDREYYEPKVMRKKLKNIL